MGDEVPGHGMPADGMPADGMPADGMPADGMPADGMPADTVAPGADRLQHLVRAMVDVGSHLDLPTVLRRIVGTATELVGARYGALGVLDPTRTSLSQFITVGLSPEEEQAIGEPPKGHGILGLLITDPQPIRLPDLTQHPDSFGFPPGHPPMHSFLGVPLCVQGKVFGNLYLTDKLDGPGFSSADEELALGLAAAAGVAIDNARLHQRIRDLDLLEDRERIARDLHDTVIQRLFATGLSLQASSRLATDPELYDRIQLAVDDLDDTVREIRSVIFSLHADRRIAGASLRRDLLRLGAELTEVLGAEPRFRFHGPVDNLVTGHDETVRGEPLTAEVLAVTREALSNVARHARPGTAEVDVTVADGWLEVVVRDAGTPPDDEVPEGDTAATRNGGQGLPNLASRAEARGGASTFEPHPTGSRLTWRVPLGHPDRS
jgi:signal transduction histidine kinase